MLKQLVTNRSFSIVVCEQKDWVYNFEHFLLAQKLTLFHASNTALIKALKWFDYK